MYKRQKTPYPMQFHSSASLICVFWDAYLFIYSEMLQVPNCGNLYLYKASVGWPHLSAWHSNIRISQSDRLTWSMSVLSATNVSWADLAWSLLSTHFAGLSNCIWIRVRQWNPTACSMKYSGASSILWHNGVSPFRIQAQWEPPFVQKYRHATAHQRSPTGCVSLWHVNEEFFSPLQSTNKKANWLFPLKQIFVIRGWGSWKKGQSFDVLYSIGVFWTIVIVT